MSVVVPVSLPVQLVSIDGNIGSGKSTFMTALQSVWGSYPWIHFLPEPVEEWSTFHDDEGHTLLECFYASPQDTAFAFQMTAFISRIHLLHRKLKDIRSHDVSCSELEQYERFKWNQLFASHTDLQGYQRVSDLVTCMETYLDCLPPALRDTVRMHWIRGLVDTEAEQEDLHLATSTAFVIVPTSLQEVLLRVLRAHTTVLHYQVTIICERSVLTDKLVFAQLLFASHHITTLEFQIYNKWFDTMSQLLPMPPLHIVYVQTEVAICAERIQQRNREGEQHITTDYLEQCHTYHMRMLDMYVPALVLNGNINKERNPTYADTWMHQLAPLM